LPRRHEETQETTDSTAQQTKKQPNKPGTTWNNRLANNRLANNRLANNRLVPRIARRCQPRAPMQQIILINLALLASSVRSVPKAPIRRLWPRQVLDSSVV
jgi:hypothetical protein